MMKKLIMIVALCLLVAGCNEDCIRTAQIQPAAWLLSGANVQSADAENEIEDTLEYIGRVGLQVGQTEAGIASDWWMDSPRQSYGVYAVQFLPQDANSLIPGIPYIGAQATLDVEDDGGMYGFVTGTILKVGGMDVVTEFQARTYTDILEKQAVSADRYKVFFGTRFKF
jgi:hypothetical protein